MSKSVIKKYKKVQKKRLCKVCNSPVNGRSDKIFCSTKCKSYYHHTLARLARDTAHEIDKILHRNRSILLELIGKSLSQKKIPRLLLERKKFRFKYHTHTHTNTQGKVYHWVYDHAWMDFSDDEVLIIKKREKVPKP